jgi:hypothetical protein
LAVLLSRRRQLMLPSPRLNYRLAFRSMETTRPMAPSPTVKSRKLERSPSARKMRSTVMAQTRRALETMMSRQMAWKSRLSDWSRS